MPLFSPFRRDEILIEHHPMGSIPPCLHRLIAGCFHQANCTPVYHLVDAVAVFIVQNWNIDTSIS